MFISGKLDIYAEYLTEYRNDVVCVEVKLPKVMGKHTLKMLLRTPGEVNDVINDLVKAKNEAFGSGAEEHKERMEALRQNK